MLTHLQARLGLNLRAVPEQGQGSESDQWEVVRASRAALGLGPREARGHPDLTESCCGFPTPCLATGESEGQPRMWSEDGRAPMRLAHGSCPVSVFPILNSGETTARSATVGTGIWA